MIKECNDYTAAASTSYADIFPIRAAVAAPPFGRKFARQAIFDHYVAERSPQIGDGCVSGDTGLSPAAEAKSLPISRNLRVDLPGGKLLLPRREQSITLSGYRQ